MTPSELGIHDPLPGDKDVADWLNERLTHEQWGTMGVWLDAEGWIRRGNDDLPVLTREGWYAGRALHQEVSDWARVRGVTSIGTGYDLMELADRLQDGKETPYESKMPTLMLLGLYYLEAESYRAERRNYLGLFGEAV